MTPAVFTEIGLLNDELYSVLSANSKMWLLNESPHLRHGTQDGDVQDWSRMKLDALAEGSPAAQDLELELLVPTTSLWYHDHGG
jgi:hypothetical protein